MFKCYKCTSLTQLYSVITLAITEGFHAESVLDVRTAETQAQNNTCIELLVIFFPILCKAKAHFSRIYSLCIQRSQIFLSLSKRKCCRIICTSRMTKEGIHSKEIKIKDERILQSIRYNLKMMPY